MSNDDQDIKKLMEGNQKKLKELEKKIKFNKLSFFLSGAIMGYTVCYGISKILEVYFV